MLATLWYYFFGNAPASYTLQAETGAFVLTGYAETMDYQLVEGGSAYRSRRKPRVVEPVRKLTFWSEVMRLQHRLIAKVSPRITAIVSYARLTRGRRLVTIAARFVAIAPSAALLVSRKLTARRSQSPLGVSQARLLVGRRLVASAVQFSLDGSVATFAHDTTVTQLAGLLRESTTEMTRIAQEDDEWILLQVAA